MSGLDYKNKFYNPAIWVLKIKLGGAWSEKNTIKK